MALLGGLLGLGLCLVLVLGVAAVAAYPVVVVLHVGLKARRAYRAARRPAESPYDAAKRRAFEAYARERAELDAQAEIDILRQLP